MSASSDTARRVAGRQVVPARLLPAVALAALGARVAYIVLVAKTTPLNGDAVENELIAGSISSGHGYSLFTLGGHFTATAHKPPLYPSLIGAASWMGLTGARAHQLISAVLGTATVLVVAAVARRAAGSRAAVLAAVLAAIYPSFLIADASLRSETLFALLVALSLLAAHAAAERPTVGRHAVLGVCIGLAALTRTEGLWLLPLLAFPLAWRAPGRHTARLALAAAVACGLVVTPWIARCWVTFGRPVLISTNVGDMLAGANCAAAYRGPGIGTWQPPCVVGGGVGNPVTVSRRLERRGLRYAREHAGRLLVVLPVRVLRTFGMFRPGQQLSIDSTEGRNRRAGEAATAFCYALLVLSAVGAWALRRRGRSLLIIAVPLALSVVVSLTAYGTTRFRISADVALVVLGAAGLDALRARPARRRRVVSG